MTRIRSGLGLQALTLTILSTSALSAVRKIRTARHYSAPCQPKFRHFIPMWLKLALLLMVISRRQPSHGAGAIQSPIWAIRGV